MYQFETEIIKDTREGKSQLQSNINCWKGISDYISSTLGPYGLDKMFVHRGGILITNDGATILKRMNYSNPAAKLLLSISENQDEEVGDGTTSVVLLASELLQKLKQLLCAEFDNTIILETLEELKECCLDTLKGLVIKFDENVLLKVAETALNSKLLAYEKNRFARMLVDLFRPSFDIAEKMSNCEIDGSAKEVNLAIKKIPGGSVKDSLLLNGVAFEKCFTYAGFEQQPKYIENPKVVCLNIELEWKAERDNAEVKITGVEEYQKVVDAEWLSIKRKLDKIVKSGANVVLSKLPVGDLATQYFAKHNVFCSGRVENEDLKRVSTLCKCLISSSISNIHVGGCDIFEEKQIGKFRFNFFRNSKCWANTIILRGPGLTMLDEMERSLNDAIMVVKKCAISNEIVCGGGSVEMELSRVLKVKAGDFGNKKLFVSTCVAQAFEIIPFTLAFNFRLDPIVVLQKLRKSHLKGDKFTGVNLSDNLADMREKSVYEPLSVKENMIKAAFSAVKSLIAVDATIIAKKRGG